MRHIETEGVKHLTNLIRIVDAYSHYMTEEEKEMMSQADKFLCRIEVLQEQEEKEVPEMHYAGRNTKLVIGGNRGVRR